MTGPVPQVGAFTLPFMFPNRDAAYKVLDGDVGKTIGGEYQQFGLISLGFPENGFREMTNSRGPIRVPAVVEGLRMRVNTSKPLNDMFAQLGAAPQRLPVADLYTALEAGVVDSQDHPLAVVLSFKFYEVQDDLSLTNHSCSPLPFFMNLEKLNSFTPEQQQILRTTAADAVKMQRELSISREESMISELESQGMEVNRDVDSAAFQEATRPV